MGKKLSLFILILFFFLAESFVVFLFSFELSVYI